MRRWELITESGEASATLDNSIVDAQYAIATNKARKCDTFYDEIVITRAL